MKIHHHEELEVYQDAFKVSVEIFEMTKTFPKEELYSLTNQIRRSSRSVAANLAEGFRKRFFQKIFISKINECEGEAAETQVWIKYAEACKYIDKDSANTLCDTYDQILGKLVKMRNNADKWSIDH